MRMKKKALIFGAGNAGRGAIAPILYDYDLIFIDNNPFIVNEINNERKYAIIEYNHNVETKPLTNEIMY